MDRNFARSLSAVLRHEGGWSDHPQDKGGATMKGVTLANFRRYVKADATKDDLRKITDAQLETVYRRFYWDAVAGAQLPDGVDFAVFDFAVNSGPARAAKYLQRVVGVKQDGKIGPATLKATRAISHATVINDLCDDRLDFLKKLKTWPTFGKGWSTRVKRVRSEALAIAARPTPEKPSVITKEIAVEVEKPVVPEKIETGVKKRSRLIQWITGLIGSGGLGIGWLANMNGDALLFAMIGLFIFIIVLVLMQNQVVSFIRKVRAEVAE